MGEQVLLLTQVLPVMSQRTVLSFAELKSRVVLWMMTVMTGVALVRKVCYSYPLQRQTLTHMFAWSLLPDGLRSVAPDAPPQPLAAERQAINEPHFQEAERRWEEKCRKAGVKYDGPGKNEDYLLGSVDIEEKERALKVTENRRDMLRKRINRSPDVDSSQQVRMSLLSNIYTEITPTLRGGGIF